MRIGVCDDQRDVREFMRDSIRKMYPGEEIILYESGNQLLEGAGVPDILFLDIQMPGTDGMATARALRESNKQLIIIFVTALEEYVFQAFDVGAFHYLVKPFSDEKFREVMSKAVQQFKTNPFVIEPKTLVVKSGGVKIAIEVDNIVYAEIFNRKIMLHTIDKNIEFYGKMSNLEKQLGEDFFRCHRSYLVNFKYVEKYNATTIFLKTETVLMAKQNYASFVKCYMKYNQKTGRD